MEDVFPYTRKNYETIVPVRHNHKYKLAKGENGLVKFVHADVELYFFLVTGGIFSMEA